MANDHRRHDELDYRDRDLERSRDWDRFDRDDERLRQGGRSGSGAFGRGRERDGGRERDEAGRRRDGSDSYGHDDFHRGLPIDETSRLIASNKVEGTAVYGRNGERLGTIYNFMVDKYSGRVDYAVMRYGGFLGLNQRYYPLPWRILTYDVRNGGYRIDMSDRDFEHAPSFTREDEPRFTRDYGRRVHNYYGLDY